MITIALLICLIGLFLYLIFTKWPEKSDGVPVAEVGRICFWVGLLAYLLVAGTKAIL